jgi:peptidoglycan/xylan/chitin deacetylase (PgdA/CDA1 family)
MSQVLTKTLLNSIPLPIFNGKKGRPIFPYCHCVNNTTPLHIRHLYRSRSISNFTDDLEWLLQNYKPVGLDDLRDWLYKGNTLPEKCFHLTVDDGFTECHDIIAPILKKFGIPATFFLCSGFINNQDMFYRHKISVLIELFSKCISTNQQSVLEKLFADHGMKYTDFPQTLMKLNYSQSSVVDAIATALEYDFSEYLMKEKPYLHFEQVEDLVKDGFSIGGHSVDHPHFQHLSLQDQLSQTRDSMAFFSERFSMPCRAFSFPHSDNNVSLEFFRNASKYVDIFFGTSRMKIDMVKECLQRFSLEDPFLKCSQIVKLNLLRHLFLSISGKQYISRTP